MVVVVELGLLVWPHLKAPRFMRQRPPGRSRFRENTGGEFSRFVSKILTEPLGASTSSLEH
jgi:hypothetical protein